MTMSELLLILGIVLFVGFTLYGSALVLTEHFWIGVLLLLFFSPIFFVWAFFRGLIGNND
jgi:hypothetical protein